MVSRDTDLGNWDYNNITFLRRQINLEMENQIKFLAQETLRRFFHQNTTNQKFGSLVILKKFLVLGVFLHHFYYYNTEDTNHLFKLIMIKKTKIAKKNHKRQQESFLSIFNSAYFGYFF